MSASGSLLDDVFALLSLASELENQSRIESATKYYEAVYLMKRYLERGIPVAVDSEELIQRLLVEKIKHYETIASKLLADDSSTNETTTAARQKQNQQQDDGTTTRNGFLLFNVPRSPIASSSGTDTEKKQQQQPTQPPPPVGEVVSFTTSTGTSDSVSRINNLAGQANTKLSYALDLDEHLQYNKAIQVYFEASEMYLTALHETEKLCKCNNNNGCNNNSNNKYEPIASVLKRRLTQTLDRIEQLKSITTAAPSNNNNILHTNNNNNKQRSTIIPVGQKKNDNKNVDNFSTISQQSHLTKEEIDILKKSSLIASGMFLPWSNADANQIVKDALYAIQQQQQQHPQTKSLLLYTDPDGKLQLSPKQREKFYTWARPSDIVRIRQKYGLTKTIQTPIMVKAITPYTIKQQYVTDCSFIASLCICAAYERRFNKTLITSIIHPQTTTTQTNNNNNNGTTTTTTPTLLYNPLGKYCIKLWLNGVARSVVIDDYLPIDQYGNLLCSHTSFTSKNCNTKLVQPYFELWVCLIEKAYMKLCGGYNFPGSNSGVDLFALTGWIPERIIFAKDPNRVKDYETHPERAFERIYSASSFGDCLITVSTELQLTQDESDRIGLVSGHAYAVLTVIQTKNGTRLLQLKNPWAHKGWKGKYSSYDVNSWTDPAFRAEVGYDPDLARQQDDGIFWVCWDDILKYFQNFHLSWNPQLFKYRLVTHGFWPSTLGPADDTFNIGENPQYILNLSQNAINQKATIWILISRHVTKQEQAGEEAKDYLTVHLHRNKGKGEIIWYPGKSGNCVLTGVYTNNPHVLVRYDIQGIEDQHLSIILSQYKKSNDLGYTLSCFCTENFFLGKPAEDLPYVKTFSSAWTKALSGGPVGQPTYSNNPMFAIHVGESGTIMQITVSTITTAAVNVLLIPVTKYGECIEKYFGDTAVIDSGNYRHGFIATDRKKIKSGSYVMVVSNFHKGEGAVFHIKIFSNNNIKAEQIR